MTRISQPVWPWQEGPEAKKEDLTDSRSSSSRRAKESCNWPSGVGSLDDDWDQEREGAQKLIAYFSGGPWVYDENWDIHTADWKEEPDEP